MNPKIEKEKFLQILEEIHTCESYNEVKLHSADTLFLSQCKFSVLRNFKIDSNSYYETMRYYQKNPKEFEMLYDTLVRRIESKVIN
jgi:hypothetical protein